MNLSVSPHCPTHLEHSVASSSHVWVFICLGNKGKILLTLILRQIIVCCCCCFFPFLAWGGLFISFIYLLIYFKEGHCPCPKILDGFQGWRWTKNSSYCTEWFPPWVSQRQETKYSNSFQKKEVLTLSRARTRLHQSGDYEQQHEAYTNSHIHLHTCCVLTSPSFPHPNNPKICFWFLKLSGCFF